MSGPQYPGSEPYPGPNPPPPQRPGATADVGIRLAARVIDWLIVAIPMNIIYTALFWVAPWFIALAWDSCCPSPRSPTSCTSRRSKKAPPLPRSCSSSKWLAPQGGIPTIDESAKRNSWMLVGVLAWLPVFFLPLFLGFIWIGLAVSIAVTINSDPRNQGWHDKFAGGTSVVRTA